jgi:dTDP-glucose pyrophosphorylase
MDDTAVKIITELDSLQIPEDASIREAIATLDRTAMQIIFVVNTNRKVIGSVTDGDIRRGLLAGHSLGESVSLVMQRDFYSLPKETGQKHAHRVMREKQFRHIPLLDDDGRLHQLAITSGFLPNIGRPNRIVIMAGGEGKRLRPLTQNCPKPMLSIGGKPLLEIMIEQCIDAGFSQFTLSVNYLKEQIISYFGNGRKWGVNIDYLEEDKPLGTVGALASLNNVSDEPLLVINGDVLTKINFAELLKFHGECESAATICVRQHSVTIPFGVVNMNGHKVSSLQEKPTLSEYVSAGIYVLSPELLGLIPKDSFFDMPQLIQESIEARHTVNAFPIHEYWLDVGHPETLAQANGEWA